MAEYFDVLDSNGNKTGEKKDRKLVHRDGDWHKAVHVWIMNSKGEFLMQKRSPNKDSHPNEWDISSAGHVVTGDDSMTTVLKEIEEELGLSASPREIELLFSCKKQSVLNNGTFINNEFNDVYLLKKDLDISTIKLQAEEVSDVRWFTAKEMESILKNKTPGYVPHPEEYVRLIEYSNKLGS